MDFYKVARVSRCDFETCDFKHGPSQVQITRIHTKDALDAADQRQATASSNTDSCRLKTPNLSHGWALLITSKKFS
jgi:hypothetical protein